MHSITKVSCIAYFRKVKIVPTIEIVYLQTWMVIPVKNLAREQRIWPDPLDSITAVGFEGWITCIPGELGGSSSLPWTAQSSDRRKQEAPVPSTGQPGLVVTLADCPIVSFYLLHRWSLRQLCPYEVDTNTQETNARTHTHTRVLCCDSLFRTHNAACANAIGADGGGSRQPAGGTEARP